MNLTLHRVTKAGQDILLTAREFKLLAYLISHKGQVCSRTDIIRDVWNIGFQYDMGVIDVFMNTLRKKLGIHADKPIKTIRGVGFIVGEDL